MNKKRILIVSPDGHSVWVLRKNLILKLIDLNYDITIMCYFDKYYKNLKSLNCKLVNYNFENKINFLKDIYLLIRLFLFFKKNKFDYIHTFTLKSNLYVPVICKVFFNPFVIISITGLGNLLNLEKKIKNKFFLIQTLIFYLIIFFYKISSNLSNKIWFQNKGDINFFNKHKIIKKKEKISLIHGSGIDHKYWNKKILIDKQYNIKKKLGIDKKKIIITMTARMIKNKKCDYYLKIYKNCIKKKLNVCFILISSRNYSVYDKLIYNKIVKNIDKNFILLDINNPTLIKKILSISDIFIFPAYKGEGLSRSILEAMSMSLPIITTNYYGCKETTIHNFNGFKITYNKMEIIIRYIEFLIKNSRIRKIFGKRSRNLIISQFSDKVIIKQVFSKLYNI